ncbi:caspase family protein [Streptomyces sp. Act143]|uniref:caspase family protein n=1 Tax=Streptomyces sp. Act143 TaxID=2200760 RepID=UPI000D675541|nr:caspase family protein [Streptomyces sp. Act143]PWI17744.1 caspase family protein [Streptomyces sp. Act143]
MGTIYAFMVGVDAYPPHIATPLSGCLNDVRAAGELVAERGGDAVEARTLTDGEATVTAVEEGISGFLGAAGPGDTALFWFSGHGSERVATGAELLVEATGRNQALVCVDGPLSDKRLGVLLDRVAGRGAQVVAVLDCCYSGGATREDRAPADLTARHAPARPDWPRARGTAPTEDAARHLLLAASRLDQLSYEGWFDGRRHGIFTHALLGAARAAGPAATYRQLLAAADARVRRSGGRQQPVLFPETAETADLPFLAGAGGVPGDHLLRCGPEGWEVDCGTAHGLRGGADAGGTEFGVIGEARVVRTRVVRADRSLVEPVDWTPDPGRAYPVTLTALASPPATVSIEGDDERLRAAVTSQATPLLHVVERPEEFGDLHFRVAAVGGAVEVLGRDGTRFVEPLRPGPRSAVRDGSASSAAAPYDGRGVVDCLTHLTRWHRLRDLTSRPSVLDNQVRVEIAPWGGGAPLVPDGRGEIVCAYGPDGEPPLVSVRLDNRSQRPLWCVLLDLTDSYASDPALFPGHFIGPGRSGHALDGEPVRLALPQSRAAGSGAEARDWLKLIVAEGELNTVPFRMRAWSPWAGGAAEDVLRFGTASDGRDLGPAVPGPSSRWSTSTVTVRTVVP